MLIKAVLAAFHGEEVILETDDKKKIVLPKSRFPEGPVVGDRMRVAVSIDNHVESADTELAKDILNEILNTGQKE